MSLVTTIQRHKPLLYWRGRPSTASGILLDYSGNGLNSTSSAGAPRRVPAPLPGDPINGWAVDAGDSSFFLGSPITGFNASEGTILTFIKIKDYTGGGNRGLFDTAPGAVGALRIFTQDDFTATFRRDVGGDPGAGSVSTAVLNEKSNVAEAHFNMWCLHWITGYNYVTVDTRLVSDGYSWSQTPASTNFAWGSVNGGSIRGGSILHSIAVFDRSLDGPELNAIYKAAYTPISRHKDF